MLRQIPNYLATPAMRGVRITAKDKRACPKSRVIRQSTWAQLETMSDSEFDGSIVLELGIGCFQRRATV